MAHSVELPSKVLELIANQIGVFASSIGPRLLRGDVPELGESLPVWILPATAVIESNPLAAAVATGRWHHQVYRRGEPELFVYSRPLGPRPEDWQVTAVFESEIAGAIDRAIRAVDDQFSGMEEVRLLVIPAYQLQALWIIGSDDQLVPAVVPRDFRDIIVEARAFSARLFFELLQRLPYVAGISP